MERKNSNLDFNNNYNSASYSNIGGDLQNWEKLKQLLGKCSLEGKKLDVSMEVLDSDLKRFLVYYPQFDPRYRKKYGVLDPKTLTFDDIRRHALEKQDLADGTVKKRMDLLAKMELHPLYPIDFNKPDWEQFFRYMDHIKINGDIDRYGKLKPVGVHGLVNRRKAWYTYTVSIGFEDIFPKYKIPKRLIPDRTRDVPICTPETVHAIITHKYVKNRDLNRYIQYLFWFGFFIGAAAEKEWIILNVDDVVIDDYGNRYITITRPKVGNKSRKLKLEKTLAASPVHKSLKNYMEYIRPKFASKNENALFPNPKTKKRWKSCDDLRRFLNKYARTVYKPFYPYLCRHWCGTARMIEWDKQGNAFSRVNYWLGHKKTDQTKTYCDFAELFNDDNGSWLSRSLKQAMLGGMDLSPGNAQQTVINGVVVQNLSSGYLESRQVRFKFSWCFYTAYVDFCYRYVKRILDYLLKRGFGSRSSFLLRGCIS